MTNLPFFKTVGLKICDYLFSSWPFFQVLQVALVPRGLREKGTTNPRKEHKTTACERGGRAPRAPPAPALWL